MEGYGYFCSLLRCCIPSLWPGMEDVKGRRRERIAELEKNMVFCWCLQDSRQMVSHRWMPWAGRSATTAIALVAGSLPQLTVWSGQLSLSLSPFCRFFPVWIASCGWLLKSQPFGCSTVGLKMAEKLSARWREKADNEKGALKEGDTEGMISGSLPMKWMWLRRLPVGISWSHCDSYVQWGCVTAAQ